MTWEAPFYFQKLTLRRAPQSDNQRSPCALPAQSLLFSAEQDTEWMTQLKPLLQELAQECPLFEPTAGEALAEAIKASGKRTLVLDLLAYPGKGDPEDPVALTIERTQRRLRLAQMLAPVKHLVEWLSLVPAWPDNSSAPHLAMLSGATAGSTKSLGQEWGIWTRTVYVSLDAMPQQWLQEELTDSHQWPEIVYSDQSRWFPVLSTTQETPKEEPLPTNPTLVISGGGLGITATIATRLREQLGPYKALILGRTKLPTEQPLPLNDPAEARKRLRQRVGKKLPPKELQALLQKELKKSQLAYQLNTLQAKGVELLYVPTDVTDAKAVEEAITQATDKWGQIDGVIHGAGVDISRSLDTKTREEVALVLGVKLGGLAHLKRALHTQPVKRWLAFGSVSGRFGNTGQFDYAAANDALARWLTTDPDFHQGLLIAYTAWDEVGMAASLSALMKERGVDMLPAKAASTSTASFFVEGQTGEWLMSGRLPTSFSQDPLLGDVTSHIPGQKLIYRQERSWGEQPFLQDHQILDAEVMPGVVSLFGLQRATQHLTWGGTVNTAQDVQLALPIKLWQGRPLKLTWHIERQESACGTPAWQGSIRSQRQRKGTVEVQEHVTARFLSQAPGSLSVSLQELQHATLLLNQPPVAADEIYKHFFHGPSWQVLETVMLSKEQAVGNSPPLTAPLGEGLPLPHRWQAVGLEMLFQVAGLWAMKSKELFVLPSRIGECVLLNQPTEGAFLEARVLYKEQQDDNLIFDALLLDQEQPSICLTGLEMKIFPMPS